MRPSGTWQSLRILPVLTLALSCAYARTAPPSPPPPAQFDVQLRYRINASRNPRIAQFLALTRYLESVGFKKDPGPETEAEDPTETRMTGTIASANAPKLLADPHVKSLLLKPAGFALPEDSAGPVKVQLQLFSGLPQDRQRVLEDQVRAKLAPLGFREAIAYDNRGHTRMVGWVPRAELDTLLGDLRWQSSGPLTPAEPVNELPTPIRDVSPILVAEVIPEPAGITPPREAPSPPATPNDGGYLQKVSLELRELAAREGPAKAMRMEAILSYTPRAGEVAWQNDFARVAPAAIVEGRVGPVVTILASPKTASVLAQLPTVSVLRLPPAASLPMRKATALSSSINVFRETGLDQLHANGNRGRGIRIAVIDADFRGFDKLIGNALPSTTRYIDVTAERSPALLPDDFSSPAGSLGHGTQCALIAILAAPEADLTLIRVDPAAPYQMRDVARFISGEPAGSFSALERRDELLADTDRLQARRDELIAQRRVFMASFGQEPDAGKRREGMLKPRAELEKEAKERDQALVQREVEQVALEMEHRARQERFLRLQRDLQGLRGTQVVASSLVWNEGYSLSGTGPLTSFFDDQPLRRTLWFQAAGDTRGQTWSGLFHDVDGNGVMEFAAPEDPVRRERWTPELNFLGWQPAGQERRRELPAKTKVRLSIQWTEAHDPSFARGGEDLFQQPLADLRLLILRQRDPTGSKLSADDMAVIARSTGLPQRLANQPDAATYEQQLELMIDEPGCYAVRVEGRVPPWTRPAGTPMLPAIQEFWELYPRLFVTAVTEPLDGRPVFLDYATDAGSLGMPADARTLLTAGSAGGPNNASTLGPPLNRALLSKPNLFASDDIQSAAVTGDRAFGTSVATPFAAGITASLLGAGVPPTYFQSAFLRSPAKLLRVPPGMPDRAKWLPPPPGELRN